MVNVDTKVQGSKLVITVDLSQDNGPSASGKTTIIASTGPGIKVATPGGDVTVGLNVYRKRSA